MVKRWKASRPLGVKAISGSYRTSSLIKRWKAPKRPRETYLRVEPYILSDLEPRLGQLFQIISVDEKEAPNLQQADRRTEPH
jgi:hypothetical protein